ncbi:MAG: acetate--CoA ligase [Coriobacteriia bacterium]|nr:acetate--CoA ligase [Coriobacteriia bacterium]
MPARYRAPKPTSWGGRPVELISPVIKRWIYNAEQNPEEFWAKAAEPLPWLKPWVRTFEWDAPTFRWFVGGETNLSYSALDHHVATGRGDAEALIYFNERGDVRRFTYAEMLEQVERISAALRGMGVTKGDRITVYMPTCPEAIMLMLATVRIGAIHSVVFAGFGENALADRVQASGSKLVFTADITYRRGKDISLKPIVDAAMEDVDCVEHVVVLNRAETAPAMNEPLDVGWDAFLAGGEGHSGTYERMESNEPAFILATSGTTAKPKLAVHTHGGYQVHVAAMARWVYGLTPDDVWWSGSDIGWIVGHSYIVYAPLVVGCTTCAFEGALDFPAAEATWKRAVEEFDVTAMFTSPTAVRLLMRYGDAPLKSIGYGPLERVFCAGEVLNAPAWDWLQNTVLQGRVPVIDHMWQTETGGPVFGNPYGLGMIPIKAGSAGIPLPGIEAEVVDNDGNPVPAGEKGIMVIKRPFPGLIATLWGEEERYGRDYWSKIEGVYYTGDAAMIDEDGYAWFAGRADEIIKIADHRIGTVEVESAFLMHPSVAESGVIGRPDELRGEIISAFVVLKNGVEPSEELQKELLATVRHELGPVAVIGEINIVSMLPKTRSGKIMRRVLKAVTLDRDPGDITTIEEEGSVEDARRAWHQMKAELG